jgi:hypothetical protein
MYEKDPLQTFLRKALSLDGKEYDIGGSKSVMIDDISWHDVTTPIGAGGIKHTSSNT